MDYVADLMECATSQNDKVGQKLLVSRSKMTIATSCSGISLVL